MHSGSAWLFGLAGLALSNALTMEKRDTPAVLAVPIIADRHISRQLSKRDNLTVDVDLDNEHLSHPTYVANITYGTPAQHLLAYFDTWGNGCWVESVNSSDCDLWTDHSNCGGYGSYNWSASTTVKKLDEKFAYDDSGSLTKGDFVTDVMTIGGAEVKEMKMGVTEAIISSNTLSLGYGNASSISLPKALADAGVIKTPAFSLWEETALFGGVDRGQYNGTLHTFPIVNGSFNGTEREKAHRINLDGMSINETDVASDAFPQDAFFDVLAGMTYVPKSVAEAINAKIGNTSVADDWGQVNFSCNALNENTTVEFKFGELTLQFYLSFFVSRTEHEQDYSYSTDEETCYLTICENTDLQYKGSVILGANFLNMVYTVFDLQNEEVSLADRSWNQFQHDIIEITADGVPGAKKDKDSAGSRVGRDLGMSALVLATTMLIIAF